MMKTSFLIRKGSARLSRGQSLVEFALAATVLIFLLVATIDFGLAFFSWITLRDAAQEGATFGSIFPPVPGDAAARTQIETRVKQAASTPVNLADLDATGTIDIKLKKIDGITDGIGCPGEIVTVTVVYNYHIITPMISNFTGSPTIPVTASVADTVLRRGTGVAAASCP